jgi:hypothetical protein
MSRHPFSKYWKGPVVFLILALFVFVALLGSHSYVLAIATLLAAVICYGVYTTGESSDLPGTAGKHNRNIPR